MHSMLMMSNYFSKESLMCSPFSCGVAVNCTVSIIIILRLTAMGQQTAKDQRLTNNLIQKYSIFETHSFIQTLCLRSYSIAECSETLSPLKDQLELPHKPCTGAPLGPGQF